MAGKEDQIKTTIAVDGEKEYKTACNNINASLREIGSEMKVVSAEFDGNAKSTEALTAKQKVLQKQLEEQNSKVKAAEDALRKMKEGGLDEANPAVVKMQTNLNNAKAEMIKTENQLQSTSNELKQSKINWDNVGETVGKVGKAFGTALAALGTAAVGAASALAGMTVSASNYADDILTMSANTHIATDDLQAYSYALNFIDGDLSTLTGTMKKNIQKMSDAADGNATYAAAYDKLGVSVTDANGNLRDSETVYWEVIDALGEVENTTERDALAMELLGKSGTELNTIIDAGSEAFKGYATEAEAMGVVMSGENLERLGAFNDKLQTLKAGTEGLKNSVALIALPFLDVLASDGIDILKDFSTGVQEANGDVSKMADVLGKGISDVLNLVIKRLPEFIDMGVQMVKSLISGIAENAPMIAEAAVQIVETLVDGIAELLPIVINGAVQIVVGLAQGLGEALPRMIPQIVEMITTIVQTLIDNIPLLITAALQLVKGLAQGLIDAIPVLIAAIPNIINSLITAILEAIPLIIQAGIDLLIALVQALPEIITAIVAAIPLIIDGIITALCENIPLIIQAGIDLLVALIQALPEIIVTIVQAIPQIIGSIVEALIGNIDQIIMAGVQLFVALIQNLPTIIIEIVKAVPQIITGIVDAIASMGHLLVEAGGQLLHGLWEGISGAASWLWEKVSGWASGLVSGIKDFFGIHSPSTVFAEIGGNMAAGVGEGFGGEMDGVEGEMTAAMGGAGALTAAEAVRAVNDGIIANISGLNQAVTAIVEQVITGLTAQATRLNQAGQDFDKNIASGMIQAITQITTKIPQIIQSMVTAFIAQHPNFITEGVDIDKSIASGMVNGIPQITAKVPQIVQPIVTALRSFVSEFTAAGEEMVRGIWQGFQNLSGWLESKVRSMMRAIVAAVEDEMDIASPSKVFAGIGEFMAAGLGEGFTREMENVEKTIRRATADTVPEATGTSVERERSATPAVQVTQNIYAQDTSYAQQQRQAAKQFKQIAREVMA